MDDRHRRAPVVVGRDRARNLARADRCFRRSICEHGQDRIPRGGSHHLRRLLRPVVMGSGLAGGCQPSGGVICCWLVPRPIDPGCCRFSPDKSACSAAAAVAPPRSRLILSRHRFASSKSRASAAASIFICRVRSVSDILSKRAGSFLVTPRRRMAQTRVVSCSASCLSSLAYRSRRTIK